MFGARPYLSGFVEYRAHFREKTRDIPIATSRRAGFAIERRDAVGNSDADNSFRRMYLVFARNIISEMHDGFASVACLCLFESSGAKYFPSAQVFGIRSYFPDCGAYWVLALRG